MNRFNVAQSPLLLSVFPLAAKSVPSLGSIIEIVACRETYSSSSSSSIEGEKLIGDRRRAECILVIVLPSTVQNVRDTSNVTKEWGAATLTACTSCFPVALCTFAQLFAQSAQ